MKPSAEYYIKVSQTILAISLFICLLIIPHYFFSLNQGGISNYGTDDRTITLFVIGFGSAALGTVLAGLNISKIKTQQRNMPYKLYVLSILYTLVMLSTFPYKQNVKYANLHLSAAFALSLAMLIFAIQLIMNANRDARMRLAMKVYAAGFLVGLCTLFGFVHLLFTAQVVCGISFGYMLTRGVAAIPKH